MKSPVTITNRAGLNADSGWIHIVPKGELANREAGIMQVLDDAGLNSIMAGIEQDKARLGDKWPGIYAGREHFIYDPSQDSAALAWFTDFQKRDDGIWANAAGLTPTGRQAIQNRDYKFTSFCADSSDLQKIPGQTSAGLPCYRVMKIETVGFTNQANGKELLTPITNRGDGVHASVTSAQDESNELLALATEIKNREGCTFDKAFNQALASRSVVVNRPAVRPASAATAATAPMAGAEFAELVKVVMGTTGCDFNEAFDRVKRAQNRIRNSQGKDRIFQNAPAAAASTLRGLAGELTAKGMKFDQAWGTVCNRHPAIVRMANRRANDPEVDPADWKDANKCASDVLAQLGDELTEPMDRGTLSQFQHPGAPAGMIRDAFRTTIQRMMTDDGLTLQEASDKLKADEPIFWTLAMLTLREKLEAGNNGPAQYEEGAPIGLNS